MTRLVEARLEAERARARLLASVKQLEAQAMDFKDRLAPRRIMGGLVDSAKGKGADLAEDAVDAVRARPIAATGVVAAIALFLAREPLMNFAGKLLEGKSAVKEKSEAKPGRKRSARTQQKTAPARKRSSRTQQKTEKTTEKG